MLVKKMIFCRSVEGLEDQEEGIMKIKKGASCRSRWGSQVDQKEDILQIRISRGACRSKREHHVDQEEKIIQDRSSRAGRRNHADRGVESA